MIKNLTLTQKLFIALSLPLIIVLINSLMAVIQLQNYRRMVKHEIVNIQESDSIKDDLGEIILATFLSKTAASAQVMGDTT